MYTSGSTLSQQSEGPAEVSLGSQFVREVTALGAQAAELEKMACATRDSLLGSHPRPANDNIRDPRSSGSNGMIPMALTDLRSIRSSLDTAMQALADLNFSLSR